MNTLLLIDLAIGITLLEALGLWAYRALKGAQNRGLRVAQYMPSLAAGLCLMLALRTSLGGEGIVLTAFFLMASGLVHGLDLWLRRAK